MILLITPSARASECAAALYETTGQEVVVTESTARATLLLRADPYEAVVLDQYLLEAEPHGWETMLGHMGTAIPMQVNLAITGKERLVREVRAAVERRHREEAAARRGATELLQCELNGTMTALLLSSELALQTKDLPQAAVERMQSVHQLVMELRRQLEGGGAKEHAEALGVSGAQVRETPGLVERRGMG